MQSHTILGLVSDTLIKKIDSLARRAFDILASGFGLLFFLPLFVVVAIAIKRDSAGPIFYRGPRAGKDEKPFGILKFRTMYECPESYQGSRVTAAGDMRVTPLGKWLRNTKVNELPQLWNVFVGEMSLVGPRPEDPEIVKHWPDRLREELLSVRPGITSPATVVFRSEESLLQSANILDDYLQTVLPDKLRLNSLYIRDRNFLKDLDIILMTLVVLLPKASQINIPEQILYWGPLSQFVFRYLNWFVLDTLVAFIAVLTAGVLWRLDAPLNLGISRYLVIALAMSLCFSLINSILHLNHIQWSRARSSEVVPLSASALLATVILILIDRFFLVQGAMYPRGNHLPFLLLVVSGFFALFGFILLRYRGRLLTGFASRWLHARGSSSIVGERVLMVGGGNNSQFASWLLSRSELARVFHIIGIVDDDPSKRGMVIDGYRVLGTTGEVAEIVASQDVGLVLFTISNINSQDREKILQACCQTGARVVIMPDVMVELRDRLQEVSLSRLYYQESAISGN